MTLDRINLKFAIFSFFIIFFTNSTLLKAQQSILNRKDVSMVIDGELRLLLQISSPFLAKSQKITVKCNGLRPKEFLIAKHLSTFNGKQYFRTKIGNVQRTTNTKCMVFVDDTSIFVPVYNPMKWLSESDVPNIKGLTFPPLNDAYEVKSVQEVRSNYDWDAESALFYSEECENIVKQTNNGIVLDEAMRRYNEEHLKPAQQVFVCMTTSPDRLAKIRYVLDSIDLTLVSRVLIALPYKFQQRTRYTIPQRLLDAYPKIELVAVSVDFGPISKVVPAVEYISRLKGATAAANDIFISLDDDNAYNRTTIDTFVYFALLNDGCTINATNNNLPQYHRALFGVPQPQTPPINGPLTQASMIEGFGGVAYRGAHIDPLLVRSLVRRDVDPQLAACFLADDVVISFCLHYANVPILGLPGNVVPNRYSFWQRRDFPYYADANALHLLRLDGAKTDAKTNDMRYYMCYQALLKHTINFEHENLATRELQSHPKTPLN